MTLSFLLFRSIVRGGGMEKATIHDIRRVVVIVVVPIVLTIVVVVVVAIDGSTILSRFRLIGIVLWPRFTTHRTDRSTFLY